MGGSSNVFVFVFLAFVATASALRFGNKPVTIDTEVLIVNRPARLTCNYVKYRTESVREINWFVGYSGFRTKIFHFSTTTGQKSGSALPFVRTEEATATENEITVTLAEFRDANMTFGCEVESLRDNGYGKLRHNKLLGESVVRVVNQMDHELLIKPDPVQGRSATPGTEMTFTCLSRGADPPPRLSFVIRGRNVSEIYGGSVVPAAVTELDEKSSAIVARLVDVSDELFRDGHLTVECHAHFDDFLFAKKELMLRRNEPSRRSPLYPGQSASSRRTQEEGWNDRYDTGRQGRVSPDMYGSSHGYGGSGYNSNSNGGGMDGKMASRLMELLDPARRSQQSLDLFAGYVVVHATNGVNDEAGATVYGELPPEVDSALRRNFVRVNKVSAGETRVKLTPVRVLNVLGTMGYRVKTNAAYNGGYSWTLERSSFEAKNEF